jgi:hypothetical protein
MARIESVPGVYCHLFPTLPPPADLGNRLLILIEQLGITTWWFASFIDPEVVDRNQCLVTNERDACGIPLPMISTRLRPSMGILCCSHASEPQLRHVRLHKASIMIIVDAWLKQYRTQLEECKKVSHAVQKGVRGQCKKVSQCKKAQCKKVSGTVY